MKPVKQAIAFIGLLLIFILMMYPACAKLNDLNKKEFKVQQDEISTVSSHCESIGWVWMRLRHDPHGNSYFQYFCLPPKD